MGKGSIQMDREVGVGVSVDYYHLRELILSRHLLKEGLSISINTHTHTQVQVRDLVDHPHSTTCRQWGQVPERE